MIFLRNLQLFVVCIKIFHSHHGAFGGQHNIKQHHGGHHHVHSKLDDQFPALKSQSEENERKSYNDPHGVKNESWHSAEGQHLLGEDDLVTILRPKNQSLEVAENVTGAQNLVNQDEQKEEDKFEEDTFEEKTVDAEKEDKSDNHLRVKVTTKTESDEDSKFNVPKEQILETIGEEYYLYDDH